MTKVGVIIGGQVIDVVVCVEVSRAVHDLGLDQGRGDHRREPGLDGLCDRHVEQSQLKTCTNTLEEVEAGSGDLGTAFHVEGVQTFGELEMVLGLEALGYEVPRGANGLQNLVVILASAGDALDDDVGDAANQRGELNISGSGGGLQLLDPVRSCLGRGHQRCLLLALCRCDLLAEGLLLGPQRLELGDARASQLVRRQDGVDDPLVLAAGTLRGSDGVGLVAQ